jgi:hypothetical protein
MISTTCHHCGKDLYFQDQDFQPKAPERERKKVCRVCGVLYPETAAYFYKRAAPHQGRRGTCKACVFHQRRHLRESDLVFPANFAELRHLYRVLARRAEVLGLSARDALDAAGREIQTVQENPLSGEFPAAALNRMVNNLLEKGGGA